MIRWWNEAVAALSDVVPIPLLVFLTLLAAALVALGWYFWPLWLPWNWRLRDGSGGSGSAGRKDTRRGGRFRLGALRWRWRRRPRKKRGRRRPLDDLPPDELPDLPANVLTLNADQLAATGRYAEAVRERLRAIVRDLIEREVIPHSPGWTVTELASAATLRRPDLVPPLRTAVSVFSEIWYGLRPARARDDLALRASAHAVTQLLAESSHVAGVTS